MASLNATIKSGLQAVGFPVKNARDELLLAIGGCAILWYYISIACVGNGWVDGKSEPTGAAPAAKIVVPVPSATPTPTPISTPSATALSTSIVLPTARPTSTPTVRSTPYALILGTGSPSPSASSPRPTPTPSPSSTKPEETNSSSKETLDLRQFMEFSITTISGTLATYLGMILGFGQKRAAAPAALRDTVPEISFPQKVAAWLYFASLIYAICLWVWYGDGVAQVVRSLAQSILGLFGGALAVLLNTEPETK